MTNLQTSYLPAAGRVLMATLFLVSGFGKLMAPAATKGYIAAAGLPWPEVAYLVAVAVELGLALALVLGYRARLVAALMAAFTVVTAFGFHADFADGNQMNHFLKNLAISGGLLYVTAYGAGGFALDALRARRARIA